MLQHDCFQHVQILQIDEVMAVLYQSFQIALPGQPATAIREVHKGPVSPITVIGTADSLGFRVVGVSDSPTCWG